MEFHSELDTAFAEALGGSDSEKKLLATLLWSARQGHLCLPLEESELRALFGFVQEEKEALIGKLMQGAKTFAEGRGICKRGAYLYLEKNAFYEERFVEHIKRLLTLPSKGRSQEKDPELTEEQNKALNQALSLPFSVICGGPGTGKTHTAARLVQAYRARFPESRIFLAAPTGKAAKKLASSLGDVNAGTIHALLQITSEASFQEEPSPLTEDLLIVDECSMIDARLFSYLLSAVFPGMHLVLMGDPEQLPPVGVGSLFADLVEILKERFPSHLTELTKHLRTQNPEILQITRSIQQGRMDFALESLTDEMVWESAASFCILSCLRKGPFGADALNEMLFKRFSSLLKSGQRLTVPIIITKNDREKELYNGETGFLIKEGAEEYALFGGARYRPEELLGYEYAYCLSVHKSQGSEYDHVLLLVPPGSEQFGREMLYTGATRAKKSLKIAGDRDTLQQTLTSGSRKVSALSSHFFC